MSEHPSTVLRRLRARSGATLAEVAAAVGKSVPYLSDLERGARNLHAIQPGDLHRLAKALDLDEDGDEARELRDAILSSFADAYPWGAMLLEELSGTGYPETLDESDPAARRRMALDCVSAARRLGLRVTVHDNEAPSNAQDLPTKDEDGCISPRSRRGRYPVARVPASMADGESASARPPDAS